MNKSTNELENLIRNTVLFDIDSEKEPCKYRTESLKLVELLYKYLCSINQAKYEVMGMEIVEIGQRCIKSFSKDKGDFINYFMVSIKNAVNKFKSTEAIEEKYGGMHIAAGELKMVRVISKYIKARNSSALPKEVLEKICNETGSDLENVLRCSALYENNQLTSNVIMGEDGKEISVFDSIAAPEDRGMLEGESEKAETINKYIQALEEAYDKCQQRQKPLLSKVLTVRLAFEFKDNPEVLKVLKKAGFFDLKIFTEQQKLGYQISNRAIAEQLGILEQSLSRTYRNFIKTVKRV